MDTPGAVLIVGKREKSRADTVAYLMELISPRFPWSLLGCHSSKRASFVAQSSSGPTGAQESTGQALALEPGVCHLGAAGRAVGWGRGWGCPWGGGEQHWSCSFTSLSHTSVESVFSRLVRFVTSHLSRGERSSPNPFLQPRLFLQCSSLGGIPSNWGPMTPALQLRCFAPGKGVV